MAVTKVATCLLLLTIVAAANAEVYFNKPQPPKADEILDSTNQLLCSYLNVNCPNGGKGFETPPAPLPTATPPATPSPGVAPVPGVNAPVPAAETPTPATEPPSVPEIPSLAPSPGRRMMKF